ncbi:MAG: 23S rRNA (cytosine1962-C5)-methyltransferase [Verrucomicrobiales bacterium]|jgi:23S rRNA (cytosine1962-C5)-methyltransferase
MPGIIVKPRSRIFHGHEWVYASEIQKTWGDPVPGSVISLKDFKDRPLGSAIYNPESQIVARRISRRKQDIDLDFFQRRLERALEHRQKLGYDEGPKVYRLVWSESDGLPGVIVERYGDQFVYQTLTLAMDQRQQLLVTALKAMFDPSCIIARNDSPIRAAEGLEPICEVVHGEASASRVEVGGISLKLDLQEGQKTGLYLDQLDNYAAVAKLAKDRRVLDCFCNQGGFALHAAVAGASEVTAVDSSVDALQAGAENATATGVEINWLEENVFDLLKKREAAEETWELIVLDPPSFTRNRKSVRDALRGYKEIHLRALKMLKPGGVLATFCCSHHVTREDFIGVICDAAVDAKRTIRLIDSYGQRADHPIIPTMPESAYLRGFSFEVISSW